MAKKKPKTSRKKGFSFRNLLSIILGIIAIELLSTRLLLTIWQDSKISNPFRNTMKIFQI